MDTLPNLKHNKQGPHNPNHNMEGGGGLMAPHRVGVCVVLVVDLLPSLPTLDIVCCVLCCAYAFSKLCAC